MASADLLPLPDVFAAAALDRVGRLLFSQLLFAHRTGFGHYIRHSRDLRDQGSSSSVISTSHTKRLNLCRTAGTAYGQRSLPPHVRSMAHACGSAGTVRPSRKSAIVRHFAIRIYLYLAMGSHCFGLSAGRQT